MVEPRKGVRRGHDPDIGGGGPEDRGRAAVPGADQGCRDSRDAGHRLRALAGTPFIVRGPRTSDRAFSHHTQPRNWRFMSAKIISGKEIAGTIRDELNERRSRRSPRKGLVPGLATVLAGDDPASRLYVGMKNKAAAAGGDSFAADHAVRTRLTEAELLELIADLNADPAIHGILVQLPLPRQIDESKVLLADRSGQGRRRLPSRQCGPPFDGRPERARAVHPPGRDRDAGAQRGGPLGQARRRGRALEHRGQADGAASASQARPGATPR